MQMTSRRKVPPQKQWLPVCVGMRCKNEDQHQNPKPPLHVSKVADADTRRKKIAKTKGQALRPPAARLRAEP